MTGDFILIKATLFEELYPVSFSKISPSSSSQVT